MNKNYFESNYVSADCFEIYPMNMRTNVAALRIALNGPNQEVVDAKEDQ